MDKQTLEHAAQQLATAELVCRGMGITAQNAQAELARFKPKSVFEGKEVKRQRQYLELEAQSAQANFERARSEVNELTAQVNSLRAQLPELSGKRYWWDVPFRTEDAVEPDTYHFDDGEYVETPPLHIDVERGFSVLRPKTQRMSYAMLSMRLTDPGFVLLHLDKKKLKLHLNDEMELRELYNTSFSWGEYGVISYMNRAEDPSVTIWRNYQAAAEARRAQYDEFLEEHEERWNRREVIYNSFVHNDIMTNEDRWLSGRMSSEDYLRESLWRESHTWGKQDKMRDDISRMRLQAEQAMREARANYVKNRKDAKYEINTLRLISVGEVIYCGDELIAVLLHNTPRAVMEYDFTPDLDLDTLSGSYHTRRELFRKKPALIPLARYVAATYEDAMPEHKVLKLRPQNCPDTLWRAWSEIRWARQVVAQK